MPSSAMARPNAERSSTSSTMPPMAYAPTHFEARARPEQHAHPDERGADHPRIAPAAEPDRREEGDGCDDERGHVRVVHGDARVGEDHAVEQDEHRRQDGDAAPAEQETREQVEAGRHHAPRR